MKRTIVACLMFLALMPIALSGDTRPVCAIEIEGVTCCCRTVDGGLCCKQVIFCSGWIAGCLCRG